MSDPRNWRPLPATEKQLRYLRWLRQRCGLVPYVAPDTTLRDASDMIDEMRRLLAYLEGDAERPPDAS